MTKKKLSKNEVISALSSEALIEQAKQIHKLHTEDLKLLIPHVKTPSKGKGAHINLEVQTEKKDAEDSSIFVSAITRVVHAAQYRSRNWLNEQQTARLMNTKYLDLNTAKSYFESHGDKKEARFVDNVMDLIEQYWDLSIGKDNKDRPTRISIPRNESPSSQPIAVTNKPRKKSAKISDNISTTESVVYGHWIASRLLAIGIKDNDLVTVFTKNLNTFCKYLNIAPEENITERYVRNIIHGKVLPSENLHKAIVFICKTKHELSEQQIAYPTFNEKEFDDIYKAAINSFAEKRTASKTL